jgi:hypothetical protein
MENDLNINFDAFKNITPKIPTLATGHFIPPGIDLAIKNQE